MGARGVASRSVYNYNVASGQLRDREQYGGILDCFNAVREFRDDQVVAGHAVPGCFAGRECDAPAKHIDRGLAGADVLGHLLPGSEGDDGLPENTLVAAEDGTGTAPT